MAKFKRLPNNFGSVCKLSGKRRKSFCARKMINGKMYYIGYYEKYEEAFNALKAFDETKIPTEKSFKEVYEEMCLERYGEEKTDGRKHMNSAFNHCKHLWDKKLKDITLEEMEETKKNKTNSAVKRIREMWGAVYDYGERHDYIFKDLSGRLKWKVSSTPNVNSSELTEDLLNPRNLSWYMLTVPRCVARDVNTIMMYTGMRPSEVLELQVGNIDLINRQMIGGMKTEAGTNRRIPIHKDLMSLIRDLLEEAKEAKRSTLLPKMSYNTLLIKMKQTMPYFAVKHSMRDWRRFVVTTCRQNRIDEAILDSFIGHAPGTVQERHYYKPTWEKVLEEYDRCMKVVFQVEAKDKELMEAIKAAYEADRLTNHKKLNKI